MKIYCNVINDNILLYIYINVDNITHLIIPTHRRYILHFTYITYTLHMLILLYTITNIL